MKQTDDLGCYCMQIHVLDDSPYRWLHEMLDCFNHGDMHRYDELCSTYASVLNAQPALVDNERKLREKITILCLMESIFKCATAIVGPGGLVSLKGYASRDFGALTGSAYCTS